MSRTNVNVAANINGLALSDRPARVDEIESDTLIAKTDRTAAGCWRSLCAWENDVSESLDRVATTVYTLDSGTNCYLIKNTRKIFTAVTSRHGFWSTSFVTAWKGIWNILCCVVSARSLNVRHSLSALPRFRQSVTALTPPIHHYITCESRSCCLQRKGAYLEEEEDSETIWLTISVMPSLIFRKS